jgi:hypothetical protein
MFEGFDFCRWPTLSAAVAFATKPLSRPLICLPPSIETMAEGCFLDYLTLPYLAFEFSCRISTISTVETEKTKDRSHFCAGMIGMITIQDGLNALTTRFVVDRRNWSEKSGFFKARVGLAHIDRTCH